MKGLDVTDCRQVAVLYRGLPSTNGCGGSVLSVVSIFSAEDPSSSSSG